MNIIYPASILNNKKVDEMFEEEYLEARSLHSCFLLNNKLPDTTDKLLYRGWMLSEAEYKELENTRNVLIPFSEYESNHYFNGWYELIKEYTIESIVCSNAEEACKKFKESGWEQCFVKDAVKSLTTKRGSIVSSVEELKEVLSELDRVRNIERYIVLRKVVELENEKEIRYFSINGKVYSPNNNPIPESVIKCGEILKDRKFCSIDSCVDTKGNHLIIEVGDGQVSDVKMWSYPDFIKMLINVG